jgi:hypothetical protein
VSRVELKGNKSTFEKDETTNEDVRKQRKQEMKDANEAQEKKGK